MNVKFLKPVEGLDVFIPNKGRSILKEGENVIVDAYVEGRIKCGSLVEVTETETKKTQEIEK